MLALRTALCICISAVVILCSGCGDQGSDAAIASVNETNVQRLANLYFAYQMKHDWKGPADEAEFKSFITAFNPQKLARIGVDPQATDELFVSQRDGQPFQFRFGVRGSAIGCSEPVVFESAGVDGKFMVGFLNMEQREVDQDEYSALLAGGESSSARQRNSRER